jgi:leucyl/phenylalanyl-tRNA--protein transferase
MFAIVSDASKVAFAILVEKLQKWGYVFVDCQVPTAHLKSLGAVEISRNVFLKQLSTYLNESVSQSAWH